MYGLLDMVKIFMLSYVWFVMLIDLFLYVSYIYIVYITQ